ncbi:MAG: M1 family metallopeptidase [Planctomycetota bacterium]
MRPGLLLPLFVLTACAGAPQSNVSNAAADVHSFAEPHRVRSRHLELDLALDFTAKVARGHVVHHIERLDADAPFVVDSDGLVVRGAFDQHGRPLFVDLASLPDPLRGQRLAVRLRADTDRVRIDYSTAPDAEAMQWLAPEQTEGGKQPFLFTQGQAILTRSWIPLQDSPSVRVTWQARIQAPAGLVPLMSAVQREERADGVRFAMDRAVPPYLIALACGDLSSRALSDRCAVWAEPSMLDLAASELADTESMVAACEALFGPYRWGRYDVLVLPPSFPFGGMANPCLTFATPTILAGDKSLVSLIAHELAHSWSGNLVTNATWRDFWLNEGFTVYLEQRIMERVFGRERAVMETRLGMQELADELQSLPAADQRLHLDLTGRNPDDAMTAVAYQKGAAFLRSLEQAFGRERLDAFLRDWFDAHAFQSVTTATFLDCLQRDLLATDAAAAARVDVARWVDGSGLPTDAMAPESALFAAVDAQLAAFRGGSAPAGLAVDGWVTQQWLRFLHGLGDCPAERMGELDGAFHFTRSGNSEVLCAWLALAIRRDYRGADRRLELFLFTVGRRKFVKPLYEALLARPEGRARAQAIYDKARPRYHAVTQRTLDAMFAAAGR